MSLLLYMHVHMYVITIVLHMDAIIIVCCPHVHKSYKIITISNGK